MEKLLKLLNEYDGKNHWWDYDEKYLTSEEFYGENGDLEIISKKFGFIKWLVENDKIDLDKLEKKFYNEICITDYGDKNRAYGKSDLVISVLSISDTPIEDLISYLK